MIRYPGLSMIAKQKTRDFFAYGTVPGSVGMFFRLRKVKFWFIIEEIL